MWETFKSRKGCIATVAVGGMMNWTIAAAMFTEALPDWVLTSALLAVAVAILFHLERITEEITACAWRIAGDPKRRQPRNKTALRYQRIFLGLLFLWLLPVIILFTGAIAGE